MDFADLQTSTEPAEMTVMHPVAGVPLTHEGEPVVLLVAGPEAPEMKAQERQVQERRLQHAQRTGKIMITAAQVENDLNDRVAKSIKGWRNVVEAGTPVDYSPAAARALIDKNPWLKDQVDEFYRDRGNFFTSTPTS